MFDRQLQYFTFLTFFYINNSRIWGSFGQKLLEETKIIIIQINNEPCSFISRTITFLKMSGVRNVQISHDATNISNSDTDTIFIIEWDLYKKFKTELQSYPIIVYNNLSFKSIFQRRLCKEGHQFIQYNKLCF